jgi:hypothetical protein
MNEQHRAERARIREVMDRLLPPASHEQSGNGAGDDGEQRQCGGDLAVAVLVRRLYKRDRAPWETYSSPRARTIPASTPG